MAVAEFEDIEGVHAPAVAALGGLGVFEGTECGEGLFCPGEPVLRWTMAVWLVRVLEESEPQAGSSRFADVDDAAWWMPYVERFADLGITHGCATEPARFCPEDPVTRAQMASFLARAFDLEAPEGSTGAVRRFTRFGQQWPFEGWLLSPGRARDRLVSDTLRGTGPQAQVLVVQPEPAQVLRVHHQLHLLDGHHGVRLQDRLLRGMTDPGFFPAGSTIRAVT